MHSEAYQEWISLYNDNIKTIWNEEKPELRKVSMIYYAFENELNRLKSVLNSELSSIRSEFKKKEYLDKQKKFIGLVQSEKFDLNTMDCASEKENNVPLEQCNSNLSETKTEEFIIESPNTAAFIAKETSPVPQTSKNITATSPVLRKNSFNFKRKNVSRSPTDKTQSSEDKTTPKLHNDSNIMECSIIDDTPDLQIERKNKRARFNFKKSKKASVNKGKQTSTLTQLFLQPQKANKSINADLPSMTVSEMINLINDSGAESDETLDLEVPTQSDANVESPTKSVPKNRSPDKKISPKFVYEEVVRGKARKKLGGWACRECEEYYEGLDLPPEELQSKKDQCSKHRHRFKPREETYTGFWDLSFGPTPKTQVDEESLVFNYKK